MDYPGGVWEIVGADEFAKWYGALALGQCAAIDARVDMLAAGGPALGRPVVDSMKGSRHSHNMKELRCSKDGALRVLFVFDPIRRAVLLLGGDKSGAGSWKAWYSTAVPHADDLYDSYLGELREEGLL